MHANCVLQEHTIQSKEQSTLLSVFLVLKVFSSSYSRLVILTWNVLGSNCPAGANSQVPPSLYSSKWVYNIVNPFLETTDELQFETTFFISAGIWWGVSGLILLITFVFLSFKIKKIAKVQKWIRMALVKVNIKPFFQEPSYLSGCFSLLAIVSIALSISFGVLLYGSSFNDKITIQVRTLR